MSEEALETWKRVVEKGAEKIRKCESALFSEDPEEFKRLHKEYVAYLKMVSEKTHISEEALDKCFLDKYSESIEV